MRLNTDEIIWDPGTSLLRCCAMECLSALECLDVEICDVRFAIRQLCADLVLLVEHHIVFPEAARSIVHTEHTLLHLHLVRWASPTDRIVFALLTPGACNGYATFRKRQASSWTP